MLARPTLGLFSIENVLNLHATLHCTAVHNFRQKRVFIICPIPVMSYTKLYDIIRISGWQGASPQLENPAMAWACKVKSFATAVRAREIRLDFMVPNSEVTQIVDIFRLMCQTELINSFRQEAVVLLQLNIVSLTGFLIWVPNNYMRRLRFSLYNRFISLIT